MKYDIAPHTKPRMVKSDSWKKRPCVLAYWAFKDECRELGMEIPSKVRLIFNIPVPPSVKGAKRVARLAERHQMTPDVDNLIKGVFDAVLDDDAHIDEVYATKKWAEVGSIEITPLTGSVSSDFSGYKKSNRLRPNFGTHRKGGAE